MTQQSVQEHYDFGDLVGKVSRGLKQAGLGEGIIDWSKLAPLDQFHTRGLLATQEMAEGLHPEPGATVLDIGCGLGGPARYLAATYGCRVTGIDLTPSYIDVARMLTERTGLSGKMTFLQGDALELPFPDESFDFAWTQHVAMNIADKERFYKGVHRVLKPGGRFAMYDVVTGENEPVIYPVPWAREAATSFLASPAEMAQALKAAGFEEISWADTTEQASAWFAEMQEAQQASDAPNPLSLGSVAGPEVRQMVANFAQNVRAGRVRYVQAVLRRN